MTHPDHHFDDELLSAYVDGELAADERAAVEERLRTDPQAAELVNELRALSGAIKSLPRETVGRDLRASIQAELDEARADDHRQVIPLSEPLDPPRGFYRGFLWSTVAIAAALMLMFLQSREQEGERDVAAAVKDDAGVVEEHTARNNRRRETRENGQLPPQGEMRSLGQPRDVAEPAAGVGGGVGSLESMAGGATGEASNLPAAAPPSPAGSAAALDSSAADEQIAQSDSASAPPADLRQDSTETASGGAAGYAAAVPGPDAAAIASAAPVIETVELQVRADDGIQRFSQLLAESNFRMPAPIASQQDDTQSERQLAAAGREATRPFYDQLRSGQEVVDDVNDPAVQVLVEGTPAQLQQLVYSYRQQPEVFGEVDASESLTRRVGEYRRELAPSAGASVRPYQPQSAAQEAEVAGEATGGSYGLAWFLTPDTVSGDKDRDAPGGIEAKEEAAKVESNVQLRAPAEAQSEGTQFARAGASAARPEVETLAKQLQSPPAAGRVRMKFVLRPAPQPADTAAPARAEP